MNRKTLTAITSVLILSTVVVGMRIFVSSNEFKSFKKEDETTAKVIESSLIMAESTSVESTNEESTSIETYETSQVTTNKKTTSQSKTETKTSQQSSKTTNETVTTITTTKAAKTETTAYTGIVTGFESEMMKKVNTLRSEENVSNLILDNNLNKIARIRAEEISKSYRSNHARPDGSDWSTALNDLDGTSLENWTSAGENIAYGQIDVNEIMEAFEASTSHRNNIVTSYYTHAGFGCYSKQGVLYWVQIFVGV